jgi:hypothetical protein
MYRSIVLFLCFFITVMPSVADGVNILNNGGFETGLMCYTNWVWSETGQDYVGDYKFALSNDAHSGAYSLEMSCAAGADCEKAAIDSDNIFTPPGQTYTLSLYSKCPVGQWSLVYIPGMANGDFSAYLTCNGNWAFNTMNFTTGSSATQFHFAIYAYDVGSVQVDDIVLTYANGTVPQQTVLHPGVRNVGVSGQTLTVDGEPYMALGFFEVPYEDLAAVAATGANTVQALGGTAGAGCFNTAAQPSYLDRAYELGLGLLPESSTTARLGVPAVYPTVMPQFAPHLANIAWFMDDEPDQADVPWYYIPGPTFVAEYNAAKPQTSLPLMADFQRAAAGGAYALGQDAPYAPGVDMWMAEPYGTDFSRVNNAVNVFNSLQRRPIWLAQDAIDAGLLAPKAYWAVINGATGIIYFTWSALESDSAKLAAVQQVFGELNGLKNAVFGLDLGALVSAPPGVGYMARYNQGTTYIFAVNPTAATAQGNFTVQGLAAGQQVTVLFENRTITASAGAFSDSFQGVSRHVYSIPSTTTTLSGAISSTTGPNTARDWKIQVSDTGLGVANSAQITQMTFTETGGKACVSSIAPGVFPVVVGNLSPGGSAFGDVVVNFAGCDSTSKFTVKISLSANSGAALGTVLRNNLRM